MRRPSPVARRTLLKGGAAVLLAALGNGAVFRLACAQAAPPRILVNVMLVGGADLRQLFVPHPDVEPAYAAAFWQARAVLTGQRADMATYRSVFASQYTPVAVGNTLFGVHNAADWLVQQLQAGSAAVIANVVGSRNRSHSHSQLIWRTGDPTASEYDYDRDGWGGRLAAAIAGSTVVTVAPVPNVFAQGPQAENRNARALHAPEPRQFALNETTSGPMGGLVGKALTSYYAAKQLDAEAMPASWPFHRILGHEKRLRGLGRALEARIADIAPQRPDSLRRLYEGPGGAALADTAFGKQCAALFDCLLAADVLGMCAAYMEHGNWDTHVNQASRLAVNFSDVFGAGKGLASLCAELARLGLGRRVLFVITSDFGRQIVANAQGGTDHGSASYSIVIGEAVRGDAIGEMFPASEIAGAPGSRPLDVRGSEIEGRTSFERVLAELCDWVAPGSGDVVFPGRSTSILEAGVDLGGLLL